jgi:probable O-glycosylation ligase (exosortase A-associated)
MILPFLFYLAKCEQIWWLKRIFQLSFVLTILAILFTYSRGAWLGLIAVLGLIFLRLEFKQKLVAAVVMVLFVPILLTNLPERFTARVETIQAYEEDDSVKRRLGAWKTAWMVATSRPFTGGGFQIIDDPNWSRHYNSEHASGHGGVHSIYFEVLAENGFITFGIYLWVLLSSILSARKVQRVSRERALQSFYCYGCMLQISFVGYVVTGAFLEFASFDLFYQLVAITIVIKVLLRQKMYDVQERAKRDVAQVDVT